jgi:hypothetical protein
MKKRNFSASKADISMERREIALQTELIEKSVEEFTLREERPKTSLS